MAKPTLLIGIGTSGMKVIEEVQHFYYENTGRNKPGNVEYLYIETDENALPKQTVIENQIKRIHISLSDKETKINNIRKASPDTWWLPPAEVILDAGFGAGGLPAFGRVALWGGDSFENVCNSITSAYGRAGSFAEKESDNSKPAVFIVGSLTGGTGSGIFIDLAYLVKDLIIEIAEVYGLFMIPGGTEFMKDPIIYCNTIAALKALEHFNNQDVTYKYRWPNGREVEFKEPPFELVQFVSQNYHGDVPSISSLDGLFKMAGLDLFLNIFGLRAKRITRLGDGKANQFIGKYGTFGLSAIQYPKAQLQEYLAIDRSIELLSRWVDGEKYYEHGTKKQIEQEKAQIHNNTLKRFEEILREAMNVLDAVNISSGNKIINDLPIKAKAVNEKDHDEPSNYHFLQNLYTSNKTGNYYHAIKNNVRDAIDIIIIRIYEMIAQTMDDTENLYLVKIKLDAIVASINETIKYWLSLKLSDKANLWENKLDKEIKWMLSGRYRIYQEQNKILTDRMRNTLDLMKMHLLAPKIQQIRDNIVKGDYPMSTFEDKTELPRVPKVNNIIKLIRSVIGLDESDRSRKFKTLLSRKSEIENDIKDTTIPILRIFPKSTFEEEVKSSLNKYIKESGNEIPSKSTVIEGQLLWDYLSQSRETLIVNMYGNTIKKFETDLNKHNSIEDLDVSHFVLKEPEEAKKIAERATFALVRINPDKETEFIDGKGIPKLVIAKNKGIIDDVVTKFKDINYHKFDNKSEDDYWTNEEMNNIIIFYNEKGYMSDKTTFYPLKHLRYIRDIERVYQEYAKKAKSEKEWHLLRNPYIRNSD